MTAGATPEGTRRYADKFRSRVAKGHFREAQGLVLPSFGIGTYLGEPDAKMDEAYRAAVVAAVENGIHLVDTAINYRFQRSERSIRAALEQLAQAGYCRDEIVLCTKGGYLTPDGSVPADANEYFFREYMQKGTLKAKDIVAGCHCIAPSYLEDQLERSLCNLGAKTIDVYYIHNPETQRNELSHEEFSDRIRAAFTLLESCVGSGKIQYYGMATWNGFRQPAGARDALQLAEMEATAREIAGEENRFRFVQLPFNLAMTEALTLGNQVVDGQRVTLIEAAEKLGITVVVSGSLLQGQVARKLPPFVRQAFGLENDAESALQFARSAPGITTALVGMSSVEHVRANARLAGVPPATIEQFGKLFERGETA